ncbi:VanZ family protein [Streptomyces sp. NPDC058642]|uniref:VanZ family protein n=1 Tax=Streptomyces sp. NPDC058642 TaxID=3346572 RepID=UPI00364BAB31
MVLYITPASVVMFVLTMLALSWVGAWWFHRNYEVASRVVRFILAAWGLLILVATLAPSQPLGTSGYYISWIPGEGMWGAGGSGLFPEERAMIVRLQIANAAMFVPFGAILSFEIFDRRNMVLAWVSSSCLALSGLIEFGQLVMAAGRTVDVDDVLFNTVGGFIGGGAALIALNIFAAPRFNGGRHRLSKVGK